MFTVLMVTFNHEDYIKDAILSIYNQDYTSDFNFIISNDCSTDRTKYIIDNLKKRCPSHIKINCYDQKKNLGAVENFNFLLSKILGGYIVVADGDDISMPHRLSYAAKYLKNNAVDLLISNAYIINNNLEKNKKLKYDDKNFSNFKIEDIYTNKTPVFGASYIFDFRLIIKYGFIDKELVTYNNIDQNIFWRAFFERGIKYTKEPLLNYRIHIQGKSLLNKEKMLEYSSSQQKLISKKKNLNELANLIYLLKINNQKDFFLKIEKKIKEKISNLYLLTNNEKNKKEEMFYYYNWNTIVFEGKHYNLDYFHLRKLHHINFIKIIYKILLNKDISKSYLIELSQLFDKEVIGKKDVLIKILLNSKKVFSNPIKLRFLLYNIVIYKLKIYLYKIMNKEQK